MDQIHNWASDDLARQASDLLSAARQIALVRENGKFEFMMELVRTNNVVLISFIEALLRDSNIRFIVADQNMSIVEGSIGIFPRRVMVDAEDIDRAKKLLRDADLEHELKSS